MLARSRLGMVIVRWFAVVPLMVTHGVAWAQPPATSTGQPAQESSSFWMAQKMRLSQEILSGLALGDFDQIGKSAEVMRGLNKIESFVRREPQGYRDHLRQFNLATNALIRSAAEENLEGATLAFNQLTISCVTCHKDLRKAD